MGEGTKTKIATFWARVVGGSVVIIALIIAGAVVTALQGNQNVFLYALGYAATLSGYIFIQKPATDKVPFEKAEQGEQMRRLMKWASKAQTALNAQPEIIQKLPSQADLAKLLARRPATPDDLSLPSARL